MYTSYFTELENSFFSIHPENVFSYKTNDNDASDEMLDYKASKYYELFQHGYTYLGHKKMYMNAPVWKIPNTWTNRSERFVSITFDNKFGDIQKLFCIYLSNTTSNKGTTIANKARTCVEILNFFQKCAFVFSEKNLDEYIDNYIYPQNVGSYGFSAGTLIGKAYAAIDFFKFLSIELNISMFPMTHLESIIKLLHKNVSHDKYKILPYQFVHDLKELLHKSIHDENLDINDRTKCAILYVIVTLGLRNSEAHNLPFDCIIYRNDKETNQSHPWICYHSGKSNGGKLRRFYMPVTQEFADEIEYIKMLNEALGKETGFAMPNVYYHQKRQTFYPSYATNSIDHMLTRICLANYDLLHIREYDGKAHFNKRISNSDLNRTYDQIKAPLYERAEFTDKELYCPKAHQFRVFAISQLFAAGVSLPEIQIMYSHRFSSSTNGYISAVNSKVNGSQMGQNEAKTVIRHTEEDPKGYLPNADSLEVYQSVDDLIDSLTGFESVESVDGGYCVSETDVDCEQLLPKNFSLEHLYFSNVPVAKESIDLILSDIEDLKKIILYNQENDFVAQNRREIKKLKMVIDAFKRALKDKTIHSQEMITYEKQYEEADKWVKEFLTRN